MNAVFDTFRETVNSQVFASVFAGGFAVSAMGFLAFQLRATPVAIWRLLKSQLSITLTVHSDQPTFHLVDLWLSRHPAVARSRRLMAVTHHTTDDAEHRLTLGEGNHFIRHGTQIWWINRHRQEVPQASSLGGQAQQSITLTTLGRRPEKFAAFMQSIREDAQADESVALHYWGGGYYRDLPRKAIRPLDSVLLPDAQVEGLVADLERFTQNRDWYDQRGVPWRRGVLLEGPPGTGKTSLIFAVAGALRKPVYLITPSALDGDSDLQSAMMNARNGIVVIEDIDAALAARDRASTATAPNAPKGPEKQPITTSGLLNAIDGIGAAEGRILFITSNHAETLDPALTRPGRCDVRLRLDLARGDVACKMFQRFFPGEDPEAFVTALAPELPLPPAEIQERLIMRAGSKNR